MNALKKLVNNKLKQQYQKHLYRSRLDFIKNQDVLQKNKLNFSSNDYLGFANNEYIVERLQKALPGLGIGSMGSNLITGYHTIHQDLENTITEYYKTEKTILFSSGYMANLAITDFLLNLDRDNSIAILDHNNHASIYDGCLKSTAKIARFKHNDISHLELILEKYKNYKNKFIFTESLFSMDGDYGKIDKIIDLFNNNLSIDKDNSAIIIDDSHNFGLHKLNKQYSINQIDNIIITGTFGKAIGSGGAFITGPKFIIESLIQFSKNYIYTTNLSPILAASSLIAIKLNNQTAYYQDKLVDNINYFYTKIIKTNNLEFKNLDLSLLNNNSPIQPIIIGDNQEVTKAASYLLQNNIIVTGIRYPSVAINKARLRLTISAKHSHEHIDHLINSLIKLDEYLQ